SLDETPGGCPATILAIRDKQVKEYCFRGRRGHHLHNRLHPLFHYFDGAVFGDSQVEFRRRYRRSFAVEQNNPAPIGTGAAQAAVCTFLATDQRGLLPGRDARFFPRRRFAPTTGSEYQQYGDKRQHCPRIPDPGVMRYFHRFLFGSRKQAYLAAAVHISLAEREKHDNGPPVGARYAAKRASAVNAPAKRLRIGARKEICRNIRQGE